MKKLLAALLALALCLPAAGALAATHTVPGLYTIQYDDALTLDTTSYLDENTADYTWLYMLICDEYAIDAEMRKLAGYEGFSLYNASEDERAEYLSATLDMLGDYGGELVATMDATASGAAIPFYVYRAQDEDGAYYMAETIAQGHSLAMYCYYMDARQPVDDTLLQALKSVLETFSPAGAQ